MTRDMDEATALQAKLKAKTHRSAIEFLRSELEVADTLIMVAETTSKHSAALRNVKNAWLALRTAEEFAHKARLDDAERNSFRDMHAALCLRLTNINLQSQEQVDSNCKEKAASNTGR